MLLDGETEIYYTFNRIFAKYFEIRFVIHLLCDCLIEYIRKKIKLFEGGQYAAPSMNKNTNVCVRILLLISVLRPTVAACTVFKGNIHPT